jgi:hypothetical protein
MSACAIEMRNDGPAPGSVAVRCNGVHGRLPPLFLGVPVIVAYRPEIADPTALQGSIINLVIKANRIGFGLDNLLAMVEATAPSMATSAAWMRSVRSRSRARFVGSECSP